MSTFYERPKRSDELYHWLYKRKYRKNGRWIYIYDDGSMSESGQHIKTNDYVTQNGTPIKETTTYKTDTSKWLNSDRKTTSVTTDGKNARVGDHRTVEYGRIHVATQNLRRHLAPNPQYKAETVYRGSKMAAKYLSHTVPKVVKSVKENAPKAYKGAKRFGRKIGRKFAQYNQRRAFDK